MGIEGGVEGGGRRCVFSSICLPLFNDGVILVNLVSLGKVHHIGHARTAWGGGGG